MVNASGHTSKTIVRVSISLRFHFLITYCTDDLIHDLIAQNRQPVNYQSCSTALKTRLSTISRGLMSIATRLEHAMMVSCCPPPHPLPNFLLFQTFASFLIFASVSVHCKDTRIAVQVRTNKPFNGRIYALGRSETCNIDVVNSDLFRLDLTMTGQDCNTQSVVSIHSA